MGEVINLDEQRPHITGDAVCLQCKHEWTAVSPIGVIDLWCPECHTLKGTYAALTAPEEVFQCNCGNQHFYIDREGAMCAKCGTRMVAY